MKPGWKRMPFVEVLEDVSAGNLKTLQSEYLPQGKFAVVDQGKALVAGFVDDASRLCNASLPVVVFGDHTCCFKFIDFPFCMGADGTKVLRPKGGHDPKYLYYYLRQVVLTDGGYDRHFKYLKRQEVVLPSIPEQQRIAKILDAAEGIRAKRRAAIVRLDTLTQAIFFEMFGDTDKNPRQLPSLPLADLVDPERPISYGILMPGEDQAEGVRYVRVVDMKDGGIDLGGIRKTTAAISNAYRRSILAAGDLLLSIRGHVGRLAVVPDELTGANITQDTARLAVHGIDPIFVREYLRTQAMQGWMQRHVKGAAVKGINLGDVKRLPIMIPRQSDQEEFARRVAAVEKLKTAHRASLAEMDALFASLQHRAFCGEL